LRIFFAQVALGRREKNRQRIVMPRRFEKKVSRKKWRPMFGIPLEARGRTA